MTQLRPDIAAHLLLAAGPALSPAPESNAGQSNTEQSNTGEANTETTEDGSDGPIGAASLAVNDQPAAADGTGTGTSATDNGTSTGSTGHEATNTYAADLASAGHEETDRSGYTDLVSVPVPNAQVLVTVPVFALLGLTDEPAVLDGYGPVPASMARKLVADGASSFYRVLVDPRDGAPLEIGRTSYRLTKAMKKALQLRDGKCTFPGCNNPSLDNEADHLTAWQHGGTTGISNLAQVCPKHHRLKHNSPWEPTPATQNEPPGWTSPTGRHYKPEQPDLEPPQWPPGLLPMDGTPKFLDAETPKVQPAEKSPLEHVLMDLLTG
jgi:hypothetical protein